MATIHVGDVPDGLYGRIKSLAAANDLSIGAEVVTLLEQAVLHQAPAQSEEEARRRHNEALESIRRRRHFFPKTEGMPDSTELLREDRSR